MFIFNIVLFAIIDSYFLFSFTLQNPVASVKKVNDFMGTNRSPEFIQQIADAIQFDKMKSGKARCETYSDKALNRVC